MPLSNAVSRKAIHTREIQCRGYQRDDGLWDIEGHLVDTKAYSFENQDRGMVGAGQPIHDMWVRLTVDDDLVVREAEATTDASPFAICGNITGRIKELEGLTVAKGWTKQVHARLGNTLGCTHITHMLTGPLATTVFQTIMPIKNRRTWEEGVKPKEKPFVIDTCHALASDGEVVKSRWPEFYTGDDKS